MHANLEMFGGEVMLHDEFPEYGGDVLAPPSVGGASVAINVNLKQASEVDAIVARAGSAGARSSCRRTTCSGESRYARIRDPFGHVWAFNAPQDKKS